MPAGIVFVRIPGLVGAVAPLPRALGSAIHVANVRARERPIMGGRRQRKAG